MVNIIVNDKKGYDWKVTLKKLGITIGMAASLAATTAFNNQSSH